MTGRARPLLIAALSLLVALWPAPAGAQDPGPGATVTLVSRPKWVRPTDQVQFAVTTTGDPATTSVQVEVFSALDSVEELEESASEDVGVRLSRTPPAPVASLPVGPDGTRLVTLRVAPEPVDDVTIQLVEPGVHPVVVSLLGPDGEVLDEVRTPLVRLGDQDDPWEAPDLAVLLDLDATPTLLPDGTRRIRPVDLRRATAVGTLLGAHPTLELTVAAVPDTVEALTGADDQEAAAVAEQLRGADVLAEPYLRLPVAAMREEGLDGLVPPLVERGTAALADLLGVVPRRGVWDGRHAVDDDGARALAGLGYRSVVVPAPEPEDDDEAVLAEAGPRPLVGIPDLLALVTDPVLSADLAAPLGRAVDAAHVELARYLLRPSEPDPGASGDPGDGDGDGDGATVLARPGPLPERSVLAGLLGLLDDPAAPVRVGGLDLVDTAVDRPEDPDEDPLVEAVSWSPEPGPDLSSVAPRILALAPRLDSFDAMLAGRSPRADDLRLQVATAVAVGTTSAGRAAAVAAAESALHGAFEAIALTGQTDLNLTSRRGTLPVTVENRNPFPVDVLVRVRSDRLAFPDGTAPGGRTPTALTIPVTIGEQDLLRIDVPVEARASGSVPVFVDLLSVDGGVELESRRLNVRSTAISGVGLVLSAGAVVVLATWWVRHIRASRRERSRPGAGAVG